MIRKIDIKSSCGRKSYICPDTLVLALPEVMDSGGIADYSCTSEETAGGDGPLEGAKGSGGLFDQDDGTGSDGGMFDSPLMNNPKYSNMWEDNE
jgi:hypothetical protein